MTKIALLATRGKFPSLLTSLLRCKQVGYHGSHLPQVQFLVPSATTLIVECIFSTRLVLSLALQFGIPLLIQMSIIFSSSSSRTIRFLVGSQSEFKLNYVFPNIIASNFFQYVSGQRFSETSFPVLHVKI